MYARRRTGILAVMVMAVVTVAAFGRQGPGSASARARAAGHQGQEGAALPSAEPAYPVRPPAAPEVLERGKGLYSANCSFCHGSTAKGGEGGPNLVRSKIVMDDKDGELIAQVVQNGRPERGMPRFTLSSEQISDIAAFIHSFPVGAHASRGVLINPVVGGAKAGEAYFYGAGNCSTCHSVTGDLAGIGSKYEPMLLQESILTGGTLGRPRPAITVKVTLPSGQIVEGKLNRIDDFIVSLTDSGDHVRTFRRSGNIPKVEVHNPLQAHLDLWRTITDEDLHNLTAYLVTLK